MNPSPSGGATTSSWSSGRSGPSAGRAGRAASPICAPRSPSDSSPSCGTSGATSSRDRLSEQQARPSQELVWAEEARQAVPRLAPPELGAAPAPFRRPVARAEGAALRAGPRRGGGGTGQGRVVRDAPPRPLRRGQGAGLGGGTTDQAPG